MVLLTTSGRPLDIRETGARAILHLWYPGSAAGQATANLLFGEAAPSGKLPFTWVTDAAMAPVSNAHLPSHAPKDAENWHRDTPNVPAYPFGYGLGYSTFICSNLEVLDPVVRPGKPVRIAVDLANTGKRRATEVAQLYIHQRRGSSSRPVRQLKGFQRIELEPGETRRIEFTLEQEDLAYWSAAVRRKVAKASVFDVWIGTDSRADLAGRFEVRGQNLELTSRDKPF